MTKISVIIPTVNAVSELDLTIKSIKQNSDHEIEFVVVVDPGKIDGQINQDILKICTAHHIKPHVNKANLGPYGNWNLGAEIATSDWLIFATDDQYFAPHWDSNLFKNWQTKRLVAGRLVEPGIIPVYKTNIQIDFGSTPNHFQESLFLKWVAKQEQAGVSQGGFFIPLLQSRKDFDALGHYPVDNSFGTSLAKSNDYLYIEHALKQGYQFVTANDSYSYHFQASSWKKKSLVPKVAAIILTKNEELDLAKCLDSLAWVNEVFVIDSGSLDNTLAIAKKYQAKIISHQFDNFAAQRNFALTKVQSFDWVLMIDADEVVEDALVAELKSFAQDIYLQGVNIPRKNYIFGKWIEHSDWYPDYRLVFFRPQDVEYESDVHERLRFNQDNASVSTAKFSLLHHNYDNVSEFLQKNLLDYPREYAQVLNNTKIKFSAVDLLSKPLGEFMRRYFLTEGYKDGMYGLVLSALMGVQTLVAYSFLWELQGKRADLTTSETQSLFASLKVKGSELTYWLTTVAIENTAGFTKLFNRFKRKAHRLIKGL